MKNRNWKDIKAELASLNPEERRSRFTELFGKSIAIDSLDESEAAPEAEPWVREILSAAFAVHSDREAGSPPSNREIDYIAVSDELPPEFLPEESEVRRRAAEIASSLREESNPRTYQQTRYRGEMADAEELVKNFGVGTLLADADTVLRQRHFEQRDRWKQEGVQASPFLSPRIFRITAEVLSRLELCVTPEIFCLPSSGIRASASMIRTGDDETVGCVAVTSAALECLDDPEIAFLIGRELGRFVLGIHRFEVLAAPADSRGGITVLPPRGESLFLRWRKKAQLSADRMGLLGCRDFEASARALLKATYALGERNLNLGIEAVLARIDGIQPNVHALRETFGGEVMLPIRLKTLHLFSRSMKAAGAGFPVAIASPMEDEALAASIDRLMELARRHPVDEFEQAVMTVVACGGVSVLCADRDPDHAEIRILVDILHHYFTDEPESIVPVAPDQIEPALTAAIDIVSRRGTQKMKTFIISRLVEVAFADGAVPAPEAARIQAIAQRLGIESGLALQAIANAEATAKIIRIRRIAGFTPSAAYPLSGS